MQARERLPTWDDPTGLAAHAMCGLASMLRQQGCFDEAERLLAAGEAATRRAVEIRAAAVGPEDLHAIADGVALASLLLAQAKYEEAEPLLRQAVAAFDDAVGGHSNEMTVSASQLASLLNATDRPGEAVELYRRVLEIRQDQLGSSDPAVVATLHNLALACDAAGRSDEAQMFWDEARAVAEPTGQATS